ncbi:putative ABC transport system permease protein [Kibdelosporangium banguiense]|uniref:ABC transport system permease protein n=1 Tax=Kibdelosporangium banguiense TaxID=1365924 RepID=A0ABS4TMF9_9PSEU|nr:ABC transporter permease [Kibdelosporangium banguiense]MBP2325600.1 putative ABC transport system permease protein [Kibdelosporangium banguiense]
MVRLTLRTLRYRKGGFVATFIALFFGAAIVMACGGLMETGIRTAIPPQRLAGADAVVVAERSFDQAKENPADEDEDSERSVLPEQVPMDAGTTAKIQAVPGVAKVVPDISFEATLLGAPTSSGHGFESAVLGAHTITGKAPQPGQVVLATSSGKQIGDQVDISVRGKVGKYTVSGLGTFAQPVMYFSAQDAQRLGELTAIGVVAAPGTNIETLQEQLTSALGARFDVLTGDERGAAEFPEVARTSEMLITLAGVFGGFAVMVSMMVVASTLGLSIRQRRREIALLRAVGTTPGQIKRMVFGEALIVSVLATGAAWVPGSWLGKALFTQLAENGVAGPEIQFHQGWIPSVVGAGAALLAAQVAAIAAARRAASTRPTEALAEAAVQRKWLTWFRLVFAVLACGGGTALAIVTVTVMEGPIAASTAGPAVLLWAIAFSLLSPGATKVMMAVIRWPIRALTSVPGSLAMSNTRVRVVQLASAVAPVMLASGFAFAQIYTQTTSVESAQRAYTENLRADAVLISTTGGFSPDVLSAVRKVPGVTAASEWVTSTGFVEAPYDRKQGDDGLALQGVTASGASELTSVSIAAGTLTGLTGNTIALPAAHADAMGVALGDKVSMRFGDGQIVPTTVVALINSKQGFETALVPATLLASHTTAGVAKQIMVRTSDPAALATIPGVRVADRSVLTEAYAAEQQTQAWINYLLAGMIILYTAISVINTLVVETADRRREFGLLRLSGARRGQVLRMAGVEGLAIAIAGIGLGTLISAGTLVPFSLAAMDSVLPYGPIWIYLAVAGAAGILTMAATLIPTWFALRPRPVDTVTAP